MDIKLLLREVIVWLVFYPIGILTRFWVSAFLFAILPHCLNRLRVPLFRVMSFRRLILAIILIFLCLFLLSTLWAPTLIDYTQVPMIMSALLLRDGISMYDTIPNTWPTSMLYGPSVVFLHWLGIMISNHPIFGVNLIGLLVGCLAVGIMGWVLLTHFSRSLAWWCWMVWFGIIMLFETPSIFIARGGDGLMIMGMVLALACVLSQSTRRWAVWVAAIGMALTWGSKIHAILYWLPLLGVSWQRRGGIWTMQLILIAIVMTMMMVVNPFVSLGGYYTILKFAANHPLLWENWVLNVLYMSVWPVLVLVVVKMIKYPIRINILWVLQVSSIGILSVFASKTGAGPWHFLPFFPLLIWQVGTILEPHWASLSKSNWLALHALALFASLFVMERLFIHSYVRYKLQDSRNQATELMTIRRNFPNENIIMGYSDTGFPSTFLMPLLHRPGQPHGWNAGSLMDLKLGGWVPTNHAGVLAQYDLIIMPNGGHPFKIKSYYSDEVNLFHDEFIAAFYHQFEYYKKGHYYSIWKKKRG